MVIVLYSEYKQMKIAPLNGEDSTLEKYSTDNNCLYRTATIEPESFPKQFLKVQPAFEYLWE